ncbi:MAG TPA: DUF222 domain-containing protein [Nocardioides sp.]|uniref:DUF222 domain-containing protein n=1 Tax=Nocardioides sp. TaxID=35761 RepID=UPI002F4186EB
MSISELSPRQPGATGPAAVLGQAGCLDVCDLARVGRHLVHVVDPDGEDRKLEKQLAREERSADLDRYLSIAPDGAGGVRVKGRGCAEDGALLKAALLPLTAPAPAVDDRDGSLVHDPRDHGARLWDALIQTAQHALDTDLPPASHGAPARLMVTIDLDTLKNGLADTAVAGHSRNRGRRVRGERGRHRPVRGRHPAVGL